MSNNDLCVPASAVGSYDDGADTLVSPEQGDEVEVTIKGRVSRVDGPNVYLTPETANGEPIAKMGGESESGDTPESMDAMMGAAMSARDRETGEGMGY